MTSTPPGTLEGPVASTGVVQWRPHPSLRPLLARHHIGFPITEHPHAGLVVPATASVQLIFKLADSPLRPPQFANGPHGSALVVEGACAPSYVTVAFAPLGAYTVLGARPGELRGEFVDLVDVIGPDGGRLAERLRDAASWPERFAALDGALARWADRGRRPAPEVVRAWHALAASGGTAPIGAIAREVGWSHKHLTARFREQVGLGPKTAARLIRFHRVRQRVAAAPARWDQVAAEGGYADQSHLVRDFRELGGMTPTQFLARQRSGVGGAEVQFLQDSEPVPLVP